MYTQKNQTKHIVHNLLNLCSNHTTFKLQRTSIQDTQFAVYVSDTPVTLKQNLGHQTESDSERMKTPSKVITMQSLKDLALMVSEKKPTIFFFFKT